MEKQGGGAAPCHRLRQVLRTHVGFRVSPERGARHRSEEGRGRDDAGWCYTWSQLTRSVGLHPTHTGAPLAQLAGMGLAIPQGQPFFPTGSAGVTILTSG